MPSAEAGAPGVYFRRRLCSAHSRGVGLKTEGPSATAALSPVRSAPVELRVWRETLEEGWVSGGREGRALPLWLPVPICEMMCREQALCNAYTEPTTVIAGTSPDIRLRKAFKGL